MRHWRGLFRGAVLLGAGALGGAGALLTLGGCAGTAVDNIDAIKSAGVTRYADNVVLVPQGQTAVREHVFVSGKELGDVTVSFGLDEMGRLQTLNLKATDVKAFEGQQAPAAAVVNVQLGFVDALLELGVLG